MCLCTHHLSFLAANVYFTLRLKSARNTAEGEAGHPPAEDLCLKSLVLPSGITQVDPRGLLRGAGTSGHPLVQHLAQRRVSCRRLTTALPCWVLNISPWIETASLDKLYQCFTIVIVNDFLLILK